MNTFPATSTNPGHAPPQSFSDPPQPHPSPSPSPSPAQPRAHGHSQSHRHAQGDITLDYHRSPALVVWETTRRCILACHHCRASANAAGDPLELSTAEGFRLIDDIAECQPQFLILSGGDPAMRPDLPLLINFAASAGLRVALSPSATPRFLRYDLHELREAGLSAMSLSLDGVDRGKHDGFRGVRGTWDRTMAAYEAARDAGIPVQINTTICKENLADFEAFAEVVREMNPMTWSLFMLVPEGRATADGLISGAQMEALFQELADIAEEVPFRVKTTEGQHFRRVQWERWRERGGQGTVRPPKQGTNDGRGFVFISHRGEVYPSGFLPVSGGNVRKEKLAGIYRDHPVFRDLRDPAALKGKCGRCPFNQLCGGSRARAYALTGDYLAPEPSCIFEPPARPEEIAELQPENVTELNLIA